MPANLDQVVKPSWVAEILAVDSSDLPELDWTKRDVRAFRDGKPDWLSEARRRHAASARQASQARAAQLDAALARLGYDAADLGTVDQALRCIDGALTHLMRVARCGEDGADRAAWRRWPKSMAAGADSADAGDGW